MRQKGLSLLKNAVLIALAAKPFREAWLPLAAGFGSDVGTGPFTSSSRGRRCRRKPCQQARWLRVTLG